MATIEKRVRLEAAIERRFSYLAEPGNSPEIWPGVLEVNEIKPSLDGRSTGGERGSFELVMVWDYQRENHQPRISTDGDYTLWSAC